MAETEKTEIEKAQELIKADKMARVKRVNEALKKILEEEDCDLIPRISAFGDEYKYEIITIAK
jgi:hypothetical protein